MLAPDSYKESLTAREVCEAMQAGLADALPAATFVQVPMADGGEGTMRSLVDARGGSVERVQVTGPLGEPVVACYGLLADQATAVIEMAAASGLELVPAERRNPLLATTRGTGELIVAALDKGVRSFIIAIGGSATNDAGTGLASALGVRFFDAHGRDLGPGGGPLGLLERIDTSGLDPRLAQSEIQVACDVDNPLCGPDGASAVYGPQKGATPAMVAELDAALARFAHVVARDVGRDVAAVPGAGAAGGLGAGLLAFTSARLRRGVEIVIDETRLADAVTGADLVLTGEGRVDSQTAHGKTPYGVACVARAAGVPVIAVAGVLGDGAEDLVGPVFDGLFPVLGRLASLDEVLADGAANVRRTCRNIAAAWWLGRDPRMVAPGEASPRRS